MRAKLIFLFALTAATNEGFTQQYERTYSNVQWNGLGFIKGTNYIKDMAGNCGIYRTEGDRRSGTLSLAIDCSAKDHKIRPGFVRDKSAIMITRQDDTQRFLRKDIYGYRDCTGKEYHFFDGESYELVTPGASILIYRAYQSAGKQRVAKFFFSNDSGELKPLTLENLDAEFSDEPLFLDKLHILARNNFQLVKYLHVINWMRLNASKGT